MGCLTMAFMSLSSCREARHKHGHTHPAKGRAPSCRTVEATSGSFVCRNRAAAAQAASNMQAERTYWGHRPWSLSSCENVSSLSSFVCKHTARPMQSQKRARVLVIRTSDVAESAII
ncbi:hypothetical protein CEV32_3158 [Brucella rhizosphaerae]|uniref:Uncharacterized protein n=1 Tax=Brucella rhizosphaerae TaxID=571254 RepID=A0A256FUX8_9HYPH|nr:hypothetical protein CEV32_3158 [Brucella rhizosphaerae]